MHGDDGTTGMKGTTGMNRGGGILQRLVTALPRAVRARCDQRALRAHCEKIIESLGIRRSEDFDLDRLIAQVSQRRGRPLRLVPVVTGAEEASGVWVSLDDEDQILYESATGPLHQLHIVLHEIGHVLCGHVGQPVVDGEQWRRLFPTLPPELVRLVMGRTCYGERAEREAEEFAWLLSARAGFSALRGADQDRWAHLDPEVGDHIDRLSTALGSGPDEGH